MSSGYGLAGGIGITPPPLPLSQPNSRLAHSPLPSSITNHLSYLHRQLMPTSQAHPAVSPSGKSCWPATSSIPTPKTCPAPRNAFPCLKTTMNACITERRYAHPTSTPRKRERNEWMGADGSGSQCRQRGQEPYNMHTGRRKLHIRGRMRRRWARLGIWGCWGERRIRGVFWAEGRRESGD